MATLTLALAGMLMLAPVAAWAGGWYLMVPPPLELEPHVRAIMGNAPDPERLTDAVSHEGWISASKTFPVVVTGEWRPLQAFDRAAPCERHRDALIFRSKGGARRAIEQLRLALVERRPVVEHTDNVFVAFGVLVESWASQCVASDDPRLARIPSGPRWQLMVAPDVDPKLPLGNRWDIVGSYVTVTACDAAFERAKRQALDQLDALRAQGVHGSDYLKHPAVSLALRMGYAECVAADDPRLTRTSPDTKAAGLLDEALKEVTSGAKPSHGVNLSKLLAERSDTAIIPFPPGRPIVSVRINGSAGARLLLDTGADHTMIAPHVLRAAGLTPRRTGTLRGVTGHATAADVYEIASLEVGAARVGRLTVFAYDAGESGMDGLLGRDFLDQFKVTIDNAAGRVTLSPK